MARVNVYKIDSSKHKEFTINMASKLTRSKNIVIDKDINANLDKDQMKFSLYRSGRNDTKKVNWEWILSIFNDKILETNTQPKAVVVIEYDGKMYALTFGHSYFLVDKFCDRNFAFSFARKMDYKEIKTTALTSPNSQRNKTINTYIDYSNLEFDSGESFTKLKAKVKQPEGFNLYTDLIEVGSSIKFTLKEETIKGISKLILHITDIMEKDDIYKIPVFSKVVNEELLEELNTSMEKEVKEGDVSINISELDIIGATEIFNHNDTTFTLMYDGKSTKVSILSLEELSSFAEDNNLKLLEILLDIKVISHFNDAPVRTDKIRNLIDYVNDEQRCILSKGEWYYFNDDYQEYLEDSIAEIRVIYNSDYDFTKKIHDDFLARKLQEENTNEGLLDFQSLKRKYYAERVFNTLREENDGFQNFDRIEERVGKSTVELMDLYKDKTMYAVKIGNSSSKLCYAVDQSISSLRLYKHDLLENMPEIDNVAIWLVLERKTKINEKNGQPNLNELDMLMLKNKLDIWKKEVRILGYTPLVYVNYRYK